MRSSSSSAQVSELLDAIRAKAGFKQLAGYSVKCLQALLSPSRLGWDIVARAAQSLDGPAAVLAVLLRYPSDYELLGFGLSALTSMHAAPGATPAAGATVEKSAALATALWAEASRAPGVDAAAAIAHFCEFALVLASRGAGASARRLVAARCRSLDSRRATAAVIPPANKVFPRRGCERSVGRSCRCNDGCGGRCSGYGRSRLFLRRAARSLQPDARRRRGSPLGRHGRGRWRR